MQCRWKIGSMHRHGLSPGVPSLDWSFNDWKQHDRGDDRKQQSCLHAKWHQNGGTSSALQSGFHLIQIAIQFFKDCNRCRCAANGIGWFCTKRACPPKEVEKRAIFKRAVQSSHNQCKPGDSWNDGCNSCLCSGKLHYRVRALLTLSSFQITASPFVRWCSALESPWCAKDSCRNEAFQKTSAHLARRGKKIATPASALTLVNRYSNRVLH